MQSLLGEKVVPEYIQEQATTENLSTEVVSYLVDEKRYKDIQSKLAMIHPMLDYDSDKRAAEAVSKLIGLGKK